VRGEEGVLEVATAEVPRERFDAVRGTLARSFDARHPICGHQRKRAHEVDAAERFQSVVLSDRRLRLAAFEHEPVYLRMVAHEQWSGLDGCVELHRNLHAANVLGDIHQRPLQEHPATRGSQREVTH
jgi:hypothetical protein